MDPVSDTPVASEHGPWPILVVGVVALLGVILVVWLFVTYRPPGAQQGQQRQQELVPPTVIEATRTGDYASAVKLAESILSDANRTSEEKALAVYSTLGARFRVSGDIEDRLRDIRDIKRFVMDDRVSAQTRANLMAMLAAQTLIGGRNPVITEEIYKDAPFSDYLIPGDPDASGRRIFEAAQSIMPTSYAAASIAHWYAAQAVFNPQIDESTRTSYLRFSRDYLASADAISLQEERNEPNFLTGMKYILFRTMRSVTTGLLATQSVEPYTEQYRSTFDDYIKFATESEHAVARSFLLYVRLMYSHALSRDDDTEAAKAQLDLMASEMAAIKEPDTHAFILMLRSEYAYLRQGRRWRLIQDMMALSPAFTAAVETAIAPVKASAGE